jgi:hypothetical protein
MSDDITLTKEQQMELDYALDTFTNVPAKRFEKSRALADNPNWQALGLEQVLVMADTTLVLVFNYQLEVVYQDLFRALLMPTFKKHHRAIEFRFPERAN